MDIYKILALALIILILIIGLIQLIIQILSKKKSSGFTIEQEEYITNQLEGLGIIIKESISAELVRVQDILEKTFINTNNAIIGTWSSVIENLTQNIRNIGDGQRITLQSLEQKINEQLIALRKEMADYMTVVRKESGDQNKEMREIVDAKLMLIGKQVNDNLSELRADNDKKLTQMRETVDEKLQNTLNTRINESFKLINTQLEAVHKGLGEMQGLTSGVNDLNRVLNNVKTRGIWGEVALEGLLDQILAPEQYGKQVSIKGGREPVDFVVVMPGSNNGRVLLPIDAKFPLNDYERLISASDNANKSGVEEARKALEKTVKSMAKDIQLKYINVPQTTDFAIMYLPIEGLFSEIVRMDGLASELQNKYRIILCGPTTLSALLNSLQIGFKTLAIQERSSEVWKLLTTFKLQFNKFHLLLQKAQKKAQEVADTIEGGVKETTKLEKSLKNLGENDFESLDISASENIDEE